MAFNFSKSIPNIFPIAISCSMMAFFLPTSNLPTPASPPLEDVEERSWCEVRRMGSSIMVDLPQVDMPTQPSCKRLSPLTRRQVTKTKKVKNHMSTGAILPSNRGFPVAKLTLGLSMNLANIIP
jgi:hypothetical protein